MGSEVCRECRYYGEYPVLQQDVKHIEKTIDIVCRDVENIKKSDTLQEASSKSMHKRLDNFETKLNNADKDRKAQTENINLLVSKLSNHMEWEEEKLAIREKQDEKDKKAMENRIKLAMIVISLIFGLATWFTGYVFDNIQESKETTIQMKEYHKTNDKEIKDLHDGVDSIDTKLDKIIDKIMGAK